MRPQFSVLSKVKTPERARQSIGECQEERLPEKIQLGGRREPSWAERHHQSDLSQHRAGRGAKLRLAERELEPRWELKEG